MLVILESTTYPGTTDEVVLPFLSNNLVFKVGKISSYVSRLNASIRATRLSRPSTPPRWSEAITPACTEMGELFFAQALETVVPVSSTRSVAEMVKLLESPPGAEAPAAQRSGCLRSRRSAGR